MKCQHLDSYNKTKKAFVLEIGTYKSMGRYTLGGKKNRALTLKPYYIVNARFFLLPSVLIHIADILTKKFISVVEVISVGRVISGD